MKRRERQELAQQVADVPARLPPAAGTVPSRRVVAEPEPAYVRGLVYHHEVSARTIYLEWEPGNGSCYRLIVTLLSGLPAHALRRMGATREAALVTWENPPTRGPLVAKLNRAVAWRYLWDKWEGQSREDVLEVARAVEAVLGWDLLTSERGMTSGSISTAIGACS